MTKVQSTKRAKPKQDPKTGLIVVGVAQDTNKNGTAGRPTTYDDKYCQMMIDYFNVEPYEDVPVVREMKITTFADGRRVEEGKEVFKRMGGKLPMFEKFAADIGTTSKTLWQWATQTTNMDENAPLKHPEFSNAYMHCKEIQKYLLVQNGLQGTYPAASFIFVAKNATDMNDTKIIENRESEAKENINAIRSWANTLRDHTESTVKST